MIICVCHRVSDRDIARAVQDGCASFEELQFELSVATACGKCGDCARETFHQHAAQTYSACGLQAHGQTIPIAPHRHHDTMPAALA
jgi:bacterioferritin-associated ferredoxin